MLNCCMRQLNIYVKPEDEVNVQVIKDLAYRSAVSTSELVHEAIAQHLLLRHVLAEVRELAIKNGLAPYTLVHQALDEYLTRHQEV